MTVSFRILIFYAPFIMIDIRLVFAALLTIIESKDVTFVAHQGLQHANADALDFSVEEKNVAWE